MVRLVVGGFVLTLISLVRAGARLHRESGRGSTGYLLWIGAQSKILVDIGGGAFLRFGQAQAKLSDLSLVAISHFHPDHVSDLPALLWLSNPTRKEPLPITELRAFYLGPLTVGADLQCTQVQ